MNTSKAVLFGSSAPTFRAPAGFPSQLRGPMMAMSPPDDPNAPAPVDPAAYAALVAAHEALKTDALAARQARDAANQAAQAAETARLAAEAEAATATGNVEEVKRTMTAQRTASEAALTVRAEKAEATVRQLLVTNGLSAALDSVKVSTELKEGALALLTGKVELVDEAGQQVAKVGGVPLADYITTWATTPQGKAYVVDGNSGGGAKGNNGDPLGVNPYADATYNLTAIGQLEASNPARAAELKRAAGK